MKYTGLQLRLQSLRVKHARNKPVRKLLMAARLIAELSGLLARNGMRYTTRWLLLRYGPASKDYGKSRLLLASLLNTWIAKRGRTFLGIANVSKLPEDRSSILHELDQALKNFPDSLDLEYDECLDFYHYFLFFDDLRIAARFRELTTRIILLEQESCSHLLPEALKAALELGRAETVLQWLEDKNPAIVDTELREAIAAHAHTLTGNRTAALRYWEKKYSPADQKYADYLRCKSIAIVGPAPPEGEPGPEIDSFDIVIRTNFNSSKPPDARLFGSRTDVSYYNHSTMQQTPVTISNAAGFLDWVNLKVPDTGFESQESSSPKPEGTRSFFVPENIFQLGYPNAIPCILYDLLAFEPRSIKLFGVNFFTSANAYSAHYAPSSGDNNSQNLSTAIRQHDPFSQLNFVVSHSRSNQVLADDLSGEILALNMSTYAERLHYTYNLPK